jgi:hypothetical protein
VNAPQPAHEAADSVRELNHLTLGPCAYVWPSDVDAVIGELGTLVQRLPQAFGQAAAWLEGQYVAGRVGHDLGGDGSTCVSEVLGEVLGDLHRAGQQARGLALTLEAARSASSHLTGFDPSAGAR